MTTHAESHTSDPFEVTYGLFVTLAAPDHLAHLTFDEQCLVSDAFLEFVDSTSRRLDPHTPLLEPAGDTAALLTRTQETLAQLLTDAGDLTAGLALTRALDLIAAAQTSMTTRAERVTR